MQTGTQVEFRTLLSKEEYTRLINMFLGNNKFDLQTNHYFDTARFTLKACDASLRVREQVWLEFRRVLFRSYNIQDFKQPITREEFEECKNTGYLPEGQIKQELESIIGKQKLENFMSLSTKRLFFTYGNGVIFLDESTYLGTTDYELEYEAKTLHEGKKEFIQLLGDLQIKYKKTDKKIKRAYDALKQLY